MNAILSSSEVETLVIMTCAGTPLPGQDATHRLVITAERSQAKSQSYITAAQNTSATSTPVSIDEFIVTPEN